MSAALEFRHESWFEEDVFELLRERGCALMAAEDDASQVQLTPTTDWGYIRMRKEQYTQAELETWRQQIEKMGWEQVFVFFKHEDEGAGPRLAAEFAELVGE